MLASFKKWILRNLSSMVISIFRTVPYPGSLCYPSSLEEATEEFSTDLSNVLFIVFICLDLCNRGLVLIFFPLKHMQVRTGVLKMFIV